jgi:hypothetical protein
MTSKGNMEGREGVGMSSSVGRSGNAINFGGLQKEDWRTKFS